MASWCCRYLGMGLLAAAVMVFSVAGRAQGTAPASRVHLELSTEVATTDANGNPTSVRIELRNVGESAVDLPPLTVGCWNGNGGVTLSFRFKPAPGNKEKGYGCAGDMLSSGTVLERARRDG